MKEQTPTARTCCMRESGATLISGETGNIRENLRRFFLCCVPAVPECHLPSSTMFAQRESRGRRRKLGGGDTAPSSGDGRCASATVTLREISGEGREGGGGAGVAGIRCPSPNFSSLFGRLWKGTTLDSPSTLTPLEKEDNIRREGKGRKGGGGGSVRRTEQCPCRAEDDIEIEGGDGADDTGMQIAAPRPRARSSESFCIPRESYGREGRGNNPRRRKQ